MDAAKLIPFLWRHGHFWGKENPDGHNVTEDDLPALTLADPVVKAAVKSYQEADGNVEFFARHLHGRAAAADGDVGPATLQTAGLPRCPIPDHVPPPGVRVKTADPGLDAAIASMQEWAAAGTGSWPPSGCDPNRRGTHSIRVRINPAGAPSAVRGYMDEALEACVAAYAEMGIAVRYILDSNSEAEITKTFARLGGSTIGINYFPFPNTCRPITGQLSSSYSPEWRLWANLETHETGHGVGLEHTRGHIMNPSILLVWPLTWKGSPSESTMRRYFGGVPLNPPVPPPPTVPPTVPPDPPPVGPPVPVPKLGQVVIDLDARTVKIPPGYRAI